MAKNRNRYEPLSGGRVRIRFTNGGSTVVDAADFDKVKDYTWTQNVKGYAQAWSFETGRVVLLHRLLMEPEQGKVVDHVDRDRLNNTRENLRVVTYTENNANRDMG